MKTLLILVALFTSSFGLAEAELIFVGAKITTLDADIPTATAIAISGSKIVFVGNDNDAKKLAGTHSRIIDVAGRRIIPGLVDAHAHIRSYGLSKMRLNLVGTKSLKEVLDRAQSKTASLEKKQWLVGRGWDQNDWDNKSFPEKEQLDSVSRNHPAYLSRIDGHAAYVNTMALAMAGITKKTKDPKGGKIIRSKNGEPTGVLIDNAMDLVSDLIAPPTRSQSKAAISLAVERASALGLTSIHDAGVSRETLEIFRELRAENKLPLRVNLMLSYSAQDLVNEFFKKGPELSRDGLIRIQSVKLFADGALGSRGAALLAPYSDDPKNSGLMLIEPDELYQFSLRAIDANFQLATHAIGDRANQQVIASYAKAFSKKGLKDYRFRIEHSQILDEKDIANFARHRIIASMQATHCTSDMPWVYNRIGSERAKEGAYVWQKLLNSGVAIANGSDAPVESLNPLWGFHAAITRQDHDEKPPKGWHPDQSMTRRQALHSFTLGAAYAARAEKEQGSLKAGKAADLVVLSKDIMTIEPKEILKTKVLYTVVNGKIVFNGHNIASKK